MRDTDFFTLPAGTICKRNGIPFELAEDTRILCSPANIASIERAFTPEVSPSTGLRSASSRNSEAGFEPPTEDPQV